MFVLSNAPKNAFFSQHGIACLEVCGREKFFQMAQFTGILQDVKPLQCIQAVIDFQLNLYPCRKQEYLLSEAGGKWVA